jgi:hypothetical protein
MKKGLAPSSPRPATSPHINSSAKLPKEKRSGNSTTVVNYPHAKSHAIMRNEHIPVPLFVQDGCNLARCGYICAGCGELLVESEITLPCLVQENHSFVFEVLDNVTQSV